MRSATRWGICMLSLCWLSSAWAQRPPESIPVSTDERVVLSYDRASVPAQQVLWLQRTVLGFSADDSLNYKSIHLLCRSETASANGRCRTRGSSEAATNGSQIVLEFRERRSGLRTDIVLAGSISRAFATSRCYDDFWEITKRPLWSTAYPTCVDEKPAGTGVELVVDGGELERLVAGRWDALLRLDLRAVNDGPILATHTFSFDVTITDHDRANIYFPASDNITPLVNLNVAYLPVPSPPHVEGGTSLDMCLYDGLGSQIPYLEVTIRDDGKDAPGRAPGMHSVWHHAGGRGDDSRLDYGITLDYGGAPLKMDNNVTQRLLGIDTTQLRLVVLPGMSQPVYCVPAPLKLTVPRVLASSKLAGYYEGRMIIEMVVPSSTP